MGYMTNYETKPWSASLFTIHEDGLYYIVSGDGESSRVKRYIKGSMVMAKSVEKINVDEYSMLYGTEIKDDKKYSELFEI